jgi:hypothetical protein
MAETSGTGGEATCFGELRRAAGIDARTVFPSCFRAFVANKVYELGRV